jgi:hypothetical protein
MTTANMNSSRSMRAVLWAVLGTSAALILLVPDLIPQVEFDSIPLINSKPLWELLVGAIVLLPFGAALYLSGRGRSGREQEMARGLALGGGGFASATLILLALVALYGLAWGGSGSGLWAMRFFACLLLIVIHAVLVWTARPGSLGSLSANSGLALISVAGYSILVLAMFHASVQLAQRKGSAYRHRMDADSKAAESAVRSIALCAISYRVANPERSLPGDLGLLLREGGCSPDLLNPQTTPEYRLTFSAASPTQPETASHAGCLVTATFIGNRLQDGRGGRFSDGRMITGDCAGVVRERQQRNGVYGSEEVVGFGPGLALRSLSQDLERFAAKTGTYHYPATLGELHALYQEESPATNSVSEYFAKQSSTDLAANVIRWRQYTLRYIPERAGSPASAPIVNFQIDARCVSYGATCLRSYRVDNQGLVHGTGQNREATVGDPLVQSCELEASSHTCDSKAARTIRRALP